MINTIWQNVKIKLRVARFLIWHILNEILAKQSFKDIIRISQFVKLAFILRKTCVNFFCITWTRQWDLNQNENRSPPRFYFEINSNLNINCRISMKNFIRACLWISAIFMLEYPKNHQFLDFFHRKINFLPG